MRLLTNFRLALREWPWRAAIWCLPIPLLFLGVAYAFTLVKGPYYLATQYDPDYAYLLNGLNLALCDAPTHHDHPGVPLQCFISAVILLRHGGVPDPAAIDALIQNPEIWLAWINHLLVWGYGLSLVYVGVAMYRRTQDVWATLIVQLTPFLLLEQFPVFLRVNPEPVLLLIGLLLVPLLWDAALKAPGLTSRQVKWMAFLAAAGLVTKVNFIPVLGGAWFILPAAWRGRFLGWLLLFGLLWTLPIAIYYSEMAKWFWLLASRQGAYGSGEVGLLNLSEWLRHLKDLGMSHGFWLMGLAGCLMLWPKWWRERHNPHSQLVGNSHLAVGLGLAGTVQWLLSAKWGYPHYLVPALGLMGLQWVVLHRMLHQWGGGRFLRRAGPLLLGAVLMATPFTQVWVWRAARQKADAQLQLAEWVRTRSAGALVLTYGASSPLLALMFGSTYSGHHLKYLIARQFERHGVEVFFYTYDSGRLCSLDRYISWQQVARRHDAILMHGTQLTPAQMRLLPAEIRVEYLGSAGGESVYQLRLQGLLPSGGAAETTQQSPE